MTMQAQARDPSSLSSGGHVWYSESSSAADQKFGRHKGGYKTYIKTTVGISSM